MITNLERYKTDLENLISLGKKMSDDLDGRQLLEAGRVTSEKKKQIEEIRGTFEREYQRWYTEASVLIRQLLPDRLAEFQELYKGDGKRKKITTETYCIQDWLNGVLSGSQHMTRIQLFNEQAYITRRFKTQKAILEAVQSRFESSLYDIRQLVQADLLDSEIDAARELIKSGFLRAAGAVAGVVLEKHLGQVVQNHSLPLRKQHPTIGDFNEILKNSNVIDVPNWRLIQRLGDLRNLCDHNKHREPSKEEVQDLVDGVEKITKTLF
jgi:hypothetical protein